MAAPGSLSVSTVPPHLLLEVWQQLRPAILRGLRHGQGDATSEQALLQALCDGRSALWAVHQGDEVIGGVVLRAIERSHGRVLFVELIAGREFHACAAKVAPLLEDYAALIGACALEAFVRPGLMGWLTNLGWGRKAIVMRKELHHGRYP